jgi:hypothetical protein
MPVSQLERDLYAAKGQEHLQELVGEQVSEAIMVELCQVCHV